MKRLNHCALAVAVASLIQSAPLRADTLIVNPDAGQIQVNGSGPAPASLWHGQLLMANPPDAGGVCNIYVPGTLLFLGTDTVSAAPNSTHPVRFVVAGNVLVEPGAVLNFASLGQQGRAGGGTGGAGGAAGAGGGGGTWGSFEGAGGSAGVSGLAGTAGFHNLAAPAGGGTGGSATGTNAGRGGIGSNGTKGSNGQSYAGSAAQSGVGGAGGGAGQDGAKGGNGGPGANGAAGHAGGNAASGSYGTPGVALVGGNGGGGAGGGGGGSGGAAGGASGVGGWGGEGGFGQDGGSGEILGSQSGGGGSGGSGGTGGEPGRWAVGGSGGSGGNGEAGAAGGAGGGAVEIRSRGLIVMGGSIRATGGDSTLGSLFGQQGQAGQAGNSGGPGGASTAGQDGTVGSGGAAPGTGGGPGQNGTRGGDGTAVFLGVTAGSGGGGGGGGRGGNGGNGGRGGDGGTGGINGAAGAGSGGTIILSGAIVDGSGEGVVAGGRGIAGIPAAGGALWINTNGTRSGQSQVSLSWVINLLLDLGNRTVSANAQNALPNPYTGTSTPRMASGVPTVGGGTFTILNDGNLAAAYGRTNLAAATTFAGVVANRPINAVAALVRTNGTDLTGADYSGYDGLYYITMPDGPAALATPGLAGVPLRDDPGLADFTAQQNGGAVPPDPVISQIGPNQVYATLVPKNIATAFTLVSASGFGIYGLADYSNTFYLISPRISTSSVPVSILVGRSANVALTVSNLNTQPAQDLITSAASVGTASMPAVKVAEGASTQRTLSVTPTVRGDVVLTIPCNDAFDPNHHAVLAKGVAPVISVTGSGTLGSQINYVYYVRQGQAYTRQVSVTNSGDGNLSGLGALSNLHGNVTASNGVTITGPMSFNLPDGQSTQITYETRLMNQGAQNISLQIAFDNGSPNGANASGNASAIEYVQVIGPAPLFSWTDADGAPQTSMQSSSISFGSPAANTPVTYAVTLQNLAQPLVPQLVAVGALKLLSHEIVGPNAARFAVPTPIDGMTLNAGQESAFNVSYLGAANGCPRRATLNILTDFLAPGGPGTPGETFSFALSTAGGSCLQPGDFDQDGDVDQADVQIFAACLTGPAISYDPHHLPQGCALTPDGNGHIAADFNQDGAVDMHDFGVFQRCYSGANKPADPDCAG